MNNLRSQSFWIKIARRQGQYRIFSFSLGLILMCICQPLVAQAKQSSAKHSSNKHLPAKVVQAKPSPELLKGCELYNGGKYNLALPYLQYASRKSPTDWTAHYYLGHTLLLLGQKSEAVVEYRYCMGCNPKPEIVSACQSAIISIYPEAAVSTQWTADTDNSALLRPNAYSRSGDALVKLEHRKAIIKQQAGEEEARINAEQFDAVRSAPRTTPSPTNLLDQNGYQTQVVDPSLVSRMAERRDNQVKALRKETQRKLDAEH